MLNYNNNCTSRTYWFDPGRTLCPVFEPEPLNVSFRIRAIHSTTLEDKPLDTSFWELSGIPTPWNLSWTEAAAYGGGLQLEYP